MTKVTQIESWIGVDIGGANIKISNPSGRSLADPFPLWKSPQDLAARLDAIISPFGASCGLAVTTTAELADCFADRSSGVRHVVASVNEVARARPVAWFNLKGNWISPEQAADEPETVAAANWLALATWIGKQIGKQSAVLLDIGSTTTDVIPIVRGLPAPKAYTDTDRLRHEELLYLGVARTPICSILKTAPYRGNRIEVAAEWFATSLDAFITLGWLPESNDDAHTADGKPALRAHSQRRLARTVLAIGKGEFSANDAQAIASETAQRLITRVQAALNGKLREQGLPLSQVILSGSGEFLGRRILKEMGVDSEFLSISKMLGTEAAICATAVALANLRTIATAIHNEAIET